MRSVYPLSLAPTDIGIIPTGRYCSTVENWRGFFKFEVTIGFEMKGLGVGPWGARNRFNNWYPSSPANAAKAKDPTIARAEMSTDRSF